MPLHFLSLPPFLEFRLDGETSWAMQMCSVRKDGRATRYKESEPLRRKRSHACLDHYTTEKNTSVLCFKPLHFGSLSCTVKPIL